MSPFASCLDQLERPVTCPGCRLHAPRWTWVVIDGLRVLTHDGDVICPADRVFDTLSAPAKLPPADRVGVAA